MWLKGASRVKTRLGAYVVEQRRAKHLSPHQLAAAVGYQNVAKGANRILALERDGTTVDGLLDNVIDALGLDAAEVQALIIADHQQFEADWRAWASEPVNPQLRFRPIPAIWCRARLPEDLSRDEAVEFGREQAMVREFTYVVVWTRAEEIWCYPNGSTRVQTMNVGEVAGPVTRLRGRGGRSFTFG
jgi:hypothetical protein